MYFSACSAAARDDLGSDKASGYSPPSVVGRITNPEITESSGLAASKCTPDVYWTHNDSGDGPFIFALDRTGRSLGTWKINGAENTDWEDIATLKDDSGKCYLYIGEIGDNQSTRSEHVIYRVSEPKVGSADPESSRAMPRETEPAAVIRWSYPDGQHDAETLLVHPATGDIYVLTKLVNGPAGIYRLRPEFDVQSKITAEKVGAIKVPAVPNGLLTGGDISPDGRRLLLCDYAAAYEFSLPEKSSDFNEIWKQTPKMIDLGERIVGEAVCYSADGNSIFATSERKNAPFIQVVSKR